MDPQSFLFQAMIYLAAAVITVPLAKRLGLGSVLGYLIAGVIIGPALLGLVGREGADLMHFAEFGVVMMLFLIGLELEPDVLWELRRPILGLGGLQVIVTTAVISVADLLFGLPPNQAIALGAILSLSSTAIVLQTLNEKGLIRSGVGQSSFSVLLFQDIAVIPMLALFPLLATLPPTVGDEAHQTGLVAGLPAWQRALAVLGSVVIIIVAGRYLVPRLFRIIAATRLRELFTASGLLLVVGIAVLMTQVGLSPALGTFLAGVVLANSEYRHELESDLEPFKGLLLGLFFIAVGATINFTLILKQPWTILGLVFLLMALKLIVLAGLGRIFRFRLEQNIFFSLALCQTGEFAFVLFSFSVQNGVLPREIVDIMTAVVAISMAVTPLLLLLYEKVIVPWISRAENSEERPADTIEEQHSVIIAGFGHFGSTVGRFLRAHRVGLTILDSNTERVELLRKMGFKVYYGDASRYDLLQAAGADRAKLILIAIEPAEKRLEMIETIKKHFPQLRMLVRASNRYDAYDQMNAGMLHVYRESMDTALRMGVDVMKLLGFRAYTAQRASRTFFRIDETNLKKLSSIKDPDEYIVSAKDKIEELERTLQADISGLAASVDRGWDEDSLIADAQKGGQGS